MRGCRFLLLIALGASACSTAIASSAERGHPLASQLFITPAPRPTPVPTPSYVPGADFTGGTVAAIEGTRLRLATLDADAHPIVVVIETRAVRSVWRETQVSASAIEVGDELMVGGSRGQDAFFAWNVWANIGRSDGIVRAIDGDTIVFDVLPPKSGIFTAVLSPYIAPLGPWHLSDLRPGMSVGTVVYWRRGQDGPRRITRIWTN